MTRPSLRALVLRSRTRRLVRRGLASFRSSLQVRVISSTLALGLLAVLVLGGYLSGQIRNGLLEQRMDEILQESSRVARQAQATMDASTAQTGVEVQELFRAVLSGVQASGPGSREVFLLQPEGSTQPVLVNDLATDGSLRPLISTPLRAATLAGDGTQHWQSVGIPKGDARVAVSEGEAVPGVVVGSAVTVPVVGRYELYLLYSLEPEQATLGFIQRMLGLGGILLVAMLGAMTWLVTRQAVLPVRQAAAVAERLADGHLAERMEVRGQDEMATLARSFNEMAMSLQVQIHQLESLSALQRRFVSDVSHELRTPLTTIRMAGDLLHSAREGFDPAARRSAELLLTQLDRFEELLADLLEISRFDAGAAVLEAEGRDVRDVVTWAVEAASPLAATKGSWLSVDLSEEPVKADIDPRRVERILRNLLVNAIEHAEGTPVEVRVVADARAVAIGVRDHGIGMTAAAAERVFDRFWRADPARTRTSGGTGLGLAIALEDAHLHGGWLQAWGAPGAGAHFVLTLPLRAGIRLEASPIDLVPPDEPVSDLGVEAETAGPADPAALPDLAAMESRWDA